MNSPALAADAAAVSPASPVRGSTRRARTIQGALPIVARGIGRRMNVEVQIGGHEASTDGRRITLPTLPFDDPDVETLAFGYLEHEASHIRYGEDVETENALHHRLCNTIEDIRIERELGREFPGFGANLSRLVSKLIETGVLQRPDANDPPGVKLRRYLSYRLRAEVLNQSGLNEYAAQAESLFRESFPAKVCVRLGSVIGRVPALRSTQDAADLAGEILDLLQEESQDPPPPPPPPPPSPDGQAQDQDATAQSATTGPLGASGDSAEAQARATVRELLAAPDEALGGELSDSIGDALQAAAQEACAQGSSSGGFGRADEPLSPTPGNAQAILASVQEASTALRTRLRSSVESVRHCRRRFARHGRRVARKRLVKAVQGDPRLFAEKRLGREVNTAIELLLDRSGSMHGERLRIALKCILTAASGLSPIRGVALEAAVFPGHTFELEMLTAFGQSLAKTATNYGAVTASGGTPLYEALLWASERLLLRKEPRKILLCATDGAPPASTRQACLETIQAAMRGGIEVYGIGIDVPDIDTLFPMSKSISDVGQLAPALFDFLRQAMTGRSGP